MRGKVWVTADPHFGHQGVCNFLRDDGTPLRPWDNVADMDAALIKNWNDRVKPEDRVYVLGDVAMSKRGFLGAVPQLNGRLVLVKGNHDVEKLSFYTPFFDDIRAYVVRKGFIMTHMPIHPSCMSRWKLNIHGHLHAHVVTKSVDNPQYGRGSWDPDIDVPDERYRCVSVEHTDYAPILLDEVIRDLQV